MGEDRAPVDVGRMAVREQDAGPGRNVVTSVVPPVTEPLQAGDDYVEKVGRWMNRCRALASSSPGAPAGERDAMVLDAQGTALSGIARARRAEVERLVRRPGEARPGPRGLAPGRAGVATPGIVTRLDSELSLIDGSARTHATFENGATESDRAKRMLFAAPRDELARAQPRAHRVGK